MKYINNTPSIVDNISKNKCVKSLLISGDDNKSNIDITIVIPTYKRSNTLKDTLDSCINQSTSLNYDIVVVDNNPERNDETENMLVNSCYNKVKYYKNEDNIGMFGNLNRCFELANSDLCVCVHDDDILSKDYLEIVYGIMHKKDEIDILYTERQYWFSSNTDYMPVIRHHPILHLRKLDYDDFLLGNPCPPTGMTVRKSSFLKTGGFDDITYPANDYAFNINCLQKFNLYFVEEKLYLYRVALNAGYKLEAQIKYLNILPTLRGIVAEKCFKLNIMKRMAINEFYYMFFKDLSMSHPQFDSQNIKNQVGFHFNFFQYCVLRIFGFSWRRFLKIKHIVIREKYYQNN